MADCQITRTRKDGPDVDRRIDGCEVAGTVYWTDQIISWIENRTNTFFTNYAGRRAEVYVRVRNNRKFLTTSPDGYGQNNLLLLPDC